jgi:hypothetical protein
MLNGLKVRVGEVVKFTMFSNWTFEQDKEYTVTNVSEMNKDGWFDIELEGFRDWYSCLHFSKTEI